MSDFPFAPFLAALAEDGIPITLHDYRRIALLLQTGGPWTLARGRDSLLALLTHDPEEQEIFLRRFDEVFAADVVISDELSAADVERILQDLATLAPLEPEKSTAHIDLSQWPVI